MPLHHAIVIADRLVQSNPNPRAPVVDVESNKEDGALACVPAHRDPIAFFERHFLLLSFGNLVGYHQLARQLPFSGQVLRVELDQLFER